MKKIILFIALSFVLSSATADTVMGKETPECWGKPIKNEAQVKCIAFFLGGFRSDLEPHGDDFDVIVRRKGNIWYVYPSKPNLDVPKNTVLYKIDNESGEAIGWNEE